MSYVPLIIFTGESNSGGCAVNSDLPTQSDRPAVQILNGSVFQPLHIGVNNLIGHAGLADNVTHGWEDGLATSVESGAWSESQVFLVKTGQGGSTISEWNESGTYFSTLKTRISLAKSAMKTLGLYPLPFVWYSQGINDAIVGTDVATWKSETVAHLKRLRSILGHCPIVSCKFPASYAAYNAALLSIDDPFFFVVESSDASLMADGNHWNSAGMALIASRMAAISVSVGDTTEAYLLRSCLALANIKATSLPVPAPGITWTSMQNASSPDQGSIQSNGTLPSGGISSLPITVTEPFSYEIEFTSLSQTCVVYIDNDSQASFSWGSSSNFISGIYDNGAGLYLSTGGSGSTLIRSDPPYPYKVRASKSGNDVVYEIDTGTGYKPLCTHAGVLSGTTTCWLKVLIATVGNRKIKVGYSWTKIL